MQKIINPIIYHLKQLIIDLYIFRPYSSINNINCPNKECDTNKKAIDFQNTYIVKNIPYYIYDDLVTKTNSNILNLNFKMNNLNHITFN